MRLSLRNRNVDNPAYAKLLETTGYKAEMINQFP